MGRDVMVIDVITVFPRILEEPLNESIIKQARKRINLKINIIDLRDFTSDKHRSVDDTPYGGGPGMILKAEPLFQALESLKIKRGTGKDSRVVFPTPQGRQFTQNVAEDLNTEKHLVFICGHYKAVDQRVIDHWVTDEISLGDFVVSGGEFAALIMIDAIVRLQPGVIGDPESARTDSFQGNLLDCPYYTKPEEYRGMKVPEVLLSGHHEKIEEWRLEKKIQRTRERRPDLYQKYLEKSSKNKKVWRT
jgi:tRNA (guanine37-N1)-methyltransferase